MARYDKADIWSHLPTIPVNMKALDANRVITARRDDPAYNAFDVLRTRMAQALKEKGWRRVAVTSPTAGCGKTFTSVNLAITLSRYESSRTLLLDLDLRKPNLHNVLGVQRPPSMGDFLRGITPVEDHFCVFADNKLHIGDNLAIGLNGRAEDFASELLQDPLTEEILETLEEDLQPDIVLFDLPPVLANDDVLAFRSQFDAVLIVASGESTRADEVRTVTRRLGEEVPILGVVLNKAEGAGISQYTA